MDGDIIVLDSDDEDCVNKQIKSKTSDTSVQNGKRPISASNETNEGTPAKKKRIQPHKIGEIQKTKEEDETSSQETVADKMDVSTTSCDTQETQETGESSNSKKEKRRNEQTKELEAFINACRKADNNPDMKKIINKKLIKYYDLVHPDYAQSKHLRKLFEDTALAILRDPKTVYSKLQDVINELKSRKNCGPIVVEQQAESTSQESNGLEIAETGDEKKDSKLRKLNKALTKLKKAIEELEEAEVNLDEEEDSAYMKKVRYEKRAVEIYNKICEITGESSHAHRRIKQPIKFKGTKYAEFNKKLSKKVNRENGFPSFYDVFRLLDYCNKEYKYGLFKEQIQSTSQDAFVKVGKLLQERRHHDLYESAEHYAGKNKDPAKEDPELKAKLEKNKEYYSKKTDEIIQLYTTKQLNGEDIEDPGESDEETMEAGCSKTSKDLQELPTEKILSIIDIKAECDTNGETSKAAAPPPIDLTITL